VIGKRPSSSCTCVRDSSVWDESCVSGGSNHGGSSAGATGRSAVVPTVGENDVEERSFLALQVRGSFGGDGGGGGSTTAATRSRRAIGAIFNNQQSSRKSERYKINYLRGKESTQLQQPGGQRNQCESEDEWKPIKGLRAIGEEKILVL
jgi:hypothetical protein